MNPAIVCMGFNRPFSLKRLLDSISQAHYSIPNIPLIISLDYGGDPDCQQIANAFQWDYGSKHVLIHKENLGLREHVMHCGDLTQQYGTVILLEDDLIVGPLFYDWVCQAIEFSRNDNRIAGVGLYSHRYNYHAHVPFTPWPTGALNFFLQIPCSWGQAWTAEQWQSFRNWIKQKGWHHYHGDLPRTITSWADSSWVKRFASYGLDTQRTWLYPIESHSTNCAEAGVHIQESTTLFQIPVSQGTFLHGKFSPLDQAWAQYDMYFENCSPLLAQAIHVNPLDFECDFYGSKPFNEYRKEWIVTTRPVKYAQKRCGLMLKPWEANLLHPHAGSDVSLTQKSKVLFYQQSPIYWKHFFFLFPNRISLKIWFKATLLKIRSWFKQKRLY